LQGAERHQILTPALAAGTGAAALPETIRCRTNPPDQFHRMLKRGNKMRLHGIERKGSRLAGFLTILLVGFLAVSCSNTAYTYANPGASGGMYNIPSPPAGKAPFSVTYFNFTQNTYGSRPVDATAYAAGATVTVLGNVGKPQLTWSGFAFKGWNTMQAVPDNLDGGNGGTFYAPGDTFQINSNVYLFGVWQ
jgi:hypothetical protein